MSTTPYEDAGGFSEIVGAASDAPAPRGHNNPPPTLKIGDDLTMDLQQRFKKVMAEAQNLLDSEERTPKDKAGNVVCPDATWEKRLTDMVRRIQGVHKELEAYRQAELRPYRENGDRVHSFFRDMMDKLVSPDAKRGAAKRYKERLEAALDGYKTMVAEEERKAREAEAAKQRAVEAAAAAEAKRIADEAAAAQRAAEEAAAAAARKRNADARAAAEAEAARLRADAAAKAAADEAARKAAEVASNARAEAEAAAAVTTADLTRIRGNASQSSQSEFVNWRDLEREKLGLMANPNAIPPAIVKLLPFIPAAALETAVNGYLKANKDAVKDMLKTGVQPLMGVVFFIDTKTKVRGA